MQTQNSPNFIRSFMVGLIASSAGAFVALPGLSMPEATEVISETEAIAPVEALASPSAEEALPVVELEAADDLSEAAEAPADALEPVAEDATEEEMPVAEEDTDEEMPVAEDATDDETIVTEEEAVEDSEIAEETVEEELEAPVAEETVEEDSEIAEETVEEELEAPVAEETVEEESEVAEETVEETVEEETAAEELNTEDFTIAELTGNSDSFEILAAALEAAELSEVLSGEGPFTVFAPTDEAFEALPEGAIDQLLMPENKDVLIQILTYHVVPGAVLSTDLETGAVETVEGSELSVEVTESVTVNNANVIAADVTASNGVIHVIDSVIMPPAPEAASADVEEEAPVQ
ncbi:MAG: fasciclin domain-containing protein [Cyanobacteria bacterium P01_D01_bin.105]